MNIDLKAIGITEEELQDRVVEALCQKLLSSYEYDPESDSEYLVKSTFGKNMQRMIQSKLDEKFEQIAKDIIQPAIADKVDNLVIQRTTQYGEKRGEPVTFLEYLTERCDQIMLEPVDAKGRTKSECERNRDSFYAAKKNMVTHMIDSQLDAHINGCVSQLVKEATTKLQAGVQDALRQTFAESASKLKVTVSRS